MPARPYDCSPVVLNVWIPSNSKYFKITSSTNFGVASSGAFDFFALPSDKFTEEIGQRISVKGNQLKEAIQRKLKKSKL